SELSQAGMAEILTRALFETMLAQRFIVGKRTSRFKLPRQPKGFRSRAEFRARLYLCASAIKLELMVKKVETGKKVAKRSITAASRRCILEAARQAKKHLGSKWIKAIQQTQSFSGLTVRQLASYCGFDTEYATLYGIQCHVAHGGDAFSGM